MDEIQAMLREETDSIQVNNPVIPKGQKHCEACGRFVNGNVSVCHMNRPSIYVCNVMCGIKVAEGKDGR